MQTSSNRDLTLAEKCRSVEDASKRVDVVVAGHVCLDIIPHLGEHLSRPTDLFIPGGLVHIGPATVALGGAVANTGLALHRLGATTRLVGKVGDDLLGKAVLESLRQHGESLSDSMVVAPGEATSYTLVISPPGVDRGFLHCPGANDTFAADDLHESAWQDARILHFGYPPLMQSVVADEGRSLAKRFAAAQAAGLIVTLDMAMPATRANATPVDWRQWLHNVLPYVDVFLPSYDELGVLLSESSQTGESATIDVDLLQHYANELLELSVPVVVIKLGDQGLYLRTDSRVSQLSQRSAWKDFDGQAWQNRDLVAPCFAVEVVGTTGAGDCTIAGFLMAMLNGDGPEKALRFATAVGAHSVEGPDATGTIPHSSQVHARLDGSWRQRSTVASRPDWQFSREHNLYVASGDAKSVSRAQS